MKRARKKKYFIYRMVSERSMVDTKSFQNSQFLQNFTGVTNLQQLTQICKNPERKSVKIMKVKSAKKSESLIGINSGGQICKNSDCRMRSH